MSALAFDDLLARHRSVLVLDTSGVAQAAWITAGGAARSASAAGDAGVALFAALRELAPDGSVSRLMAGAEAFVFCAGPGSVLGIRSAALALRVWNSLQPRPVYSYLALELLAAAGGPGEAYVADARRGLWHWQVAGAPAERLEGTEIEARAAAGGLRLATPEGFRAWGPVPPSVVVVPYQPLALLRATGRQPLLRPAPAPDALLQAEPAYVRWQPQLHRSPAAIPSA